MKQHKSFELVKLDNNKMFLICKTYEKIPEFYLELEKVLNKLKFDGYVYFDKLSFTHNKDRFIKVRFTEHSFVWTSSKVIKGNETFKKITSDYFYNHQYLLDNTLLLKSEKQKIIDGLSI